VVSGNLPSSDGKYSLYCAGFDRTAMLRRIAGNTVQKTRPEPFSSIGKPEPLKHALSTARLALR
jgi:Txe/YoeB family toxin of Txe-Axe toxin-antitoxin module